MRPALTPAAWGGGQQRETAEELLMPVLDLDGRVGGGAEGADRTAI